ncbi:MAG: hypothetical protein HC880_18035, partial [Bacteroidia bacterium]|nr:hypothetical protein [Bacteroidia bacterium]
MKVSKLFCWYLLGWLVTLGATGGVWAQEKPVNKLSLAEVLEIAEKRNWEVNQARLDCQVAEA